jgi:hypothetical protein
MGGLTHDSSIIEVKDQTQEGGERDLQDFINQLTTQPPHLNETTSSHNLPASSDVMGLLRRIEET